METSESPMETRPLTRMFDYVKYDEDSVKVQEMIKFAFQRAEEAVSVLKDGRAKSLTLTYLEIAYMWTGKAIRDEQIARLGSPHVPERSNQ